MRSQRALLSIGLALLLALCGCASRGPQPPATAAPEAAPSQRSCAFCPEQSPKDCTLCVTSNPLLTVDKDGATSGTLRLCNRASAAATMDLTVSDFHSIDPGVQPYPLSTIRTVTAVNSEDSPIVAGKAPLAPNGCVDLKVDADRVWQAGLSVAELKDGPTKIIQLKAVRYQVPFNVRIEGQTEAGVNILFTRGSQAAIRLRNDDELAYRLRWRLELADLDKSGEEFIPGHGLATIKLECPQTNFSLVESGFFRPATRVGTLTLQFAPGDAGFGVLPLPHKQFPVAARLSFFGDVNQRVVNYLSILLLLLLGIGLSLLINQVLPAQRKIVAIKQRLANLEGRLAGFAGSIDSRLLGLLRLEKKRMRAELRELWPIFPQTSQELPKLETRIDWLVQRVELTARIGDLLNDVELNPDDLATSEVDAIRMHCREVLDLVRRPSAAADEIQSAQKHAQLAEEIRDRADDPPTTEAVQALRNLAAAVSSRIPKPPYPAGSGWTALEDLLTALKNDVPPAGTIDRVDFVRHSRVVRALTLGVEFAELVDRAGSDRVRSSRLARVQELRAALEPGRDASLGRAQNIVRQIEQNVTKEDLLEEMKSPGTMRIEIDPPTPIEYQLVTFRVRFDRPGLDGAVAQDEIACNWHVDGHPLDGRDAPDEIRIAESESHHARGWIRGECFSNGPVRWQLLTKRMWQWLMVRIGRRNEEATKLKAHTIEARFPALPDVKVKGLVNIERTKSYVESRSILASASLLITVLIVALGLLAGAQDKLQALDWLSGAVAVLALGFGADTVKTLITRS